MFGEFQQDLCAARQAGRFLVLGDFNAHTGLLCDWDDTRALMNELGLSALAYEGVVPPRRNTDTRPADGYGQSLIDACKSAGLLIGNGRLPEDTHGARTFLRGNPSVIGYCLLDPALYTLVRSFAVQQKLWEWGDHAPLSVVVGLGFLFARAGQAGGGASSAQQQQQQQLQPRRIPKWDPERKELYALALSTGEVGKALQGIADGVKSGQLPAAVAAEQLCQQVHDTACGVFGVVSNRPNRCVAGRRPNAWFKHCKDEWRQLQQAISRGDTAAAAAYRRAFNAKKRRWKRYYSHHMMA
jgi:hypothetical protein